MGGFQVKLKKKKKGIQFGHVVVILVQYADKIN